MSDVDATGELPRIRPMNRIRVAYDGDPISARVELLVQTDRGEEIHDVPFDSFALYVDGRGKTRLAVTVGEEHITAQIVGPLDFLAESKLMSAAKLPRTQELKIGEAVQCPGDPARSIPPATCHRYSAEPRTEVGIPRVLCERCGQHLLGSP